MRSSLWVVPALCIGVLGCSDKAGASEDSAPAITTQPTSVTVTPNSAASFSVTATGAAPLTYQWRKNAGAIAGATSSTYAITSAQAGDAGTYDVVVSNPKGSARSNGATLTVSAALSAPVITTQPSGKSVTAGSSATFTVAASGNPAPTYQWQRNNGGGWNPVSGATSASYSLSGAQVSDNGAQFRCVATNSQGSATSNGATLTVSAALSAPVITTQPSGKSVTAGSSATFTVAASGNPAPTYQWQRNNGGGWNPVSGATSGSYTLSGAQVSDNGAQFRCVATNSQGNATSNGATLTVSAAGALAPPVFTAQPESRLAATGSSPTYAVTVTGSPTPALQWQRSSDGTTWSDIGGATSTTLTLANVTASNSNTKVRCLASNNQGTDMSDPAVLVTQTPGGTTYYVSPSGNDSNDGLTLGTAWATISHAADSSSPVGPGDTVYVAAGTYNETVELEKAGTPGNPIVFQGYKTTPGDAPLKLVDRANAYTAFNGFDMPLINGGDRTSGIGLDSPHGKNLVIRNFQIRNVAYGVNLGDSTQNAGSNWLDNVGVMTVGDPSDDYQGEGILMGSMGTRFTNSNMVTDCLVVNACAEGIDVNGTGNVLVGCKVYCNDNTDNAPTDYYIMITGDSNAAYACYIERAPGLSHAGHGLGAKTNAEQVVDQGLNLPAISARYNQFIHCTARNMGESFYVRHRTAQYNLFYRCTAIGTYSGASQAAEGEGNGIETRDGASDNVFDGLIVRNCDAGIQFQDTVEDGDSMGNPPGHPGNNNLYKNCLILNCRLAVDFDDYSVASDAGDNTIADCTFFKNRYLFDCGRECNNMKYVGNIFEGTLQDGVGGAFFSPSHPTYDGEVIPNGVNSYFKNCDFHNIEGGMPSGFVSAASGSIASDPMFVDPANLNFRLTPGSPCVDSGLSVTGVSTDRDGIGRPQGGTPDMGAYEAHTP